MGGGYYGSTKRCQIDLLKPGEQAVPFVPRDKLYKAAGNYDNMRVMPFIAVLFLKVQAWRQRATSDQLHHREKVPQDVRDIDELLGIAERRGYKLKDVKDWLPGWIQDVGKRRIEQYKREHPYSSSRWAAVLG